jgi:hypothetical protein
MTGSPFDDRLKIPLKACCVYLWVGQPAMKRSRVWGFGWARFAEVRIVHTSSSAETSDLRFEATGTRVRLFLDIHTPQDHRRLVRK